MTNSSSFRPLSRSTFRGRRALAVSILGVAALLSACSSSKEATTSTAAVVVSDTATADIASGDTSVAADSQASPNSPAGVDPVAQKAFTDCLKENGVDLPEGGLGTADAGAALPEGVDQAKLQTAFAACSDKLPAGAPGGLPGLGAGGAGGPDFSAFTTCLKDNGVTVPEPFDISKVDLKDPGFAAASQTCAPLLPADSSGAAAPTTVAAG